MQSISLKDNKISYKGVYIAAFVISCWFATILFAFNYATTLFNPWNILLILLLTHLYTGLFITAHDSIHGTVSKNSTLNNFIGKLCVILYACFSYSKIKEKHHNHHKFVTSEKDPDYDNSNFFLWFWKFMKNYMVISQLLLMAFLYNVLNLGLGIPKLNLVLFWIIPPILSSLQLFYFGTYLPHKNPEEIHNKFKSRSQNINIFWGFISCYFFGYHYEHHSRPSTPWWNLWKEKTPQLK